MVDKFSAVCDGISLPNTLINIVSMVQKVSTQRRSGKEKCAELLVDAFTLKDMIDSPNTTDDDFQVQRLENLIVKIKDCLVKFAKGNLIDDAAEAMFKSECPELRKEYQQLEERFILGAINDIRNNLSHTVSLWHKVLETKRDSKLGPSFTHVTIDISTLNWQGSIGRGKAAAYGDIECRKLNIGLSSQRALHLYHDLQHRSHIQKIHGILEMNDQSFVVMEDCSTLKSLKDWRNDANRVLTLKDRVNIAYDVAQSIAWLHEGGLLVKYLTESSICLKGDHNSRQRPVLTQLHYTRCLYERTNSMRIDHRYEAPEILMDLLERKEPIPHSHETDIWSLGIVVWQILTDGTPYLIEEDMYFYNPQEDAATLKRGLESHRAPGDFPAEFPLPLITIVQSCWSPIDQGRPSAMVVASSLLRALALLDNTAILAVEQCVSGSLKYNNPQGLAVARAAAWELVRNARSRAKAKNEQTGQLSDDHASLLLRHVDDEKHPENAFLVGSLIWWELIDVRLVTNMTTPHSLGLDGRRAELSLKYLLKASDRKYMQAHFEIARAYAALYHDYNARIKVVEL